VEDDSLDQRALPVPEHSERPHGRHESARRSVGGPAGAAIVIVVAAVVLAGVLATWLISSAKEAPSQGAGASPTQGGPTSRPPGAFGNLVPNWSFERDLSGWQVLGEADASREPQGRTSGSSASMRARGPEPGPVGLALPEVVSAVKAGQRYVASAWVRSSASGQQVTLRVVGGGGTEVSKKTAATLAGLEWRRIIVDHTVVGPGGLGLEIVADGVPAGDAVLVDEVVVRQG
jgi:hypothetical protein